MSAEFQFDVFLSHSAKDKAVVRVPSLSASNGERAGVRCRSLFQQDGVRVWLDEEQLPSPAGAGEGGRRPGEGRGENSDSIPAKIEDGLEHSRVLVLCMSAHAFGSDWAQLEAGTCGRRNLRFRDPLNQERRFIPLRLDDGPIKGSLAQFLYINCRPADREQEYAKLVEACRNPASWPQGAVNSTPS